MEHGSNMHNTLESIPRFGGGKEIRECRSKVRMTTSCHKKSVFVMRNGALCPASAGADTLTGGLTGGNPLNAQAIEQWKENNSGLFSSSSWLPQHSQTPLFSSKANVKETGSGTGLRHGSHSPRSTRATRKRRVVRSTRSSILLA